MSRGMMLIRPKIRGFVCVTAHPVGCAAHVREQIAYVKSRPPIEHGCKKALIIGASTGYGLASRIAAAFGCGAATIGVYFERPSENGRCASAGWYNSVAFEKEAEEAGLYATGFNGDAFSDDMKKQVIERIKADLGQVDLVVYSLASPRRTHPRTGETSRSALKPIGQSFTAKTVDTDKEIVTDITVDPASVEEITQTINVMGGEDWEMWIEALASAGVLTDNARTLAYSYIGPELTFPIYRNGTIGRAKADLEATAHRINDRLSRKGGGAHVSINKALVSQASSAIPVVPLYISLLYKVMKEKGLHEGCIEQMTRLFAERLYSGERLETDRDGRIRIDDWEMRDDVQQAVEALWPQVNTDNLKSISDFEGYQKEFLKLFGFGLDGVDYEVELEP